MARLFLCSDVFLSWYPSIYILRFYKMYESWYLEQYSQYNDLFHEDFEILGLKIRGSGTRLRELERLKNKNVLDWVEDSNDDQAPPGRGSLNLLQVLNHEVYIAKAHFNQAYTP